MVYGASSSFPLLQLPNAPLKCVLQNIFLHQQVGISMLSKRTKELVKSLNLEAREISVDINGFVHMQVIGSQNSILIDLCFQTSMLLRHVMATLGNSPFPTVMYTPDSVRTYNREDDGQTRSYEWKNRQGFEIKDWINHLLSIFHRPKLDCLHFTSHAPFDLDSLVKTINDVNKIRIVSRHNYPNAYVRQIVQTFPSAKELYLQMDFQRNLEVFNNIFCQNYDVFKLAPLFLERVPRVSLNDLLIMNSRSIKIENSSLSQKDVNDFLKHWKNGSNPRMEHFEAQFHQNTILNMGILDGLDYQIVPFERKRAFKGSSNGIVEGGYDIKRMNGTTATITIHQEQYQALPGFPNFPVFTLQLYVWH